MYLKERYEIYYEEDVTLLKNKRRRKDLISTVFLLIMEAIGLILFLYFFGPISLIPYILAQFIFLPYPVIRTPSHFSITDRGIILDKKALLPYSRIKKVEVQSKLSLVLAKDFFGKEFLRLYSRYPNKVAELINSKLRSFT